MGQILKLAQGAAVGAGVMYFLDPERGKRRRAILRDQAVHFGHRLERGADTTKRDLAHRTEGLIARARHGLRRDDVPDPVITARVRSALGRRVSHPGSIDVSVHDGYVTLDGPILTHELRPCVDAVRRVRGVKGVENRLEPHDEPGDVPGLQGGRVREGRKPELLQTNWAPGPRFVVGALGGTLALKGLLRGGFVGTAQAVAGLLLFARAATNMELKRLTGLGAGRRAVDIHKTFHVNAPVDEVFRLCEHPEQYPRFMSNVREVTQTGPGRFHWVVDGPAGLPVEYDAEMTSLIPNEVIAWKTVGASAVPNAGIIRFQPDERGGTRMDIHMAYNPPGGAITHAIATLFGFDAKHRLEEDLVRFQSLLEQGKTTAHGERVTRSEIEQAL